MQGRAPTHVLALSAGGPGPGTPRGRKHTQHADLIANVILQKQPGAPGRNSCSRAGGGHTGGLGAPHARKWGIAPRNQTRRGWQGRRDRRGSEGVGGGRRGRWGSEGVGGGQRESAGIRGSRQGSEGSVGCREAQSPGVPWGPQCNSSGSVVKGIMLDYDPKCKSTPVIVTNSRVEPLSTRRRQARVPSLPGSSWGRLPGGGRP